MTILGTPSCFGRRCAARIVAGADEVTQLAPIAIDEAVREGDLIAGALRVIHLPGKSAGEIGLYFDPAHHAVSREMGGILLLDDAIIGNPPKRAEPDSGEAREGYREARLSLLAGQMESHSR